MTRKRKREGRGRKRERRRDRSSKDHARFRNDVKAMFFQGCRRRGCGTLEEGLRDKVAREGVAPNHPRAAGWSRSRYGTARVGPSTDADRGVSRRSPYVEQGAPRWGVSWHQRASVSCSRLGDVHRLLRVPVRVIAAR